MRSQGQTEEGVGFVGVVQAADARLGQAQQGVVIESPIVEVVLGGPIQQLVLAQHGIEAVAAIKLRLAGELGAGATHEGQRVASGLEQVAQAVDAGKHVGERLELVVVHQPRRHQRHAALAGNHAGHGPAGVVELLNAVEDHATLAQRGQVFVGITEALGIGIGALGALQIEIDQIGRLLRGGDDLRRTIAIGEPRGVVVDHRGATQRESEQQRIEGEQK